MYSNLCIERAAHGKSVSRRRLIISVGYRSSAKKALTDERFGHYLLFAESIYASTNAVEGPNISEAI
jgi:hypothetical protein